MIASYYSKLLQKSNSTAKQPHRVPHMTLYITFNKRHHQVSEGLVNLTEIVDTNSGSPAPRAKMLPLLYPPIVQSKHIQRCFMDPMDWLNKLIGTLLRFSDDN